MEISFPGNFKWQLQKFSPIFYEKERIVSQYTDDDALRSLSPN